MVSLQQLDPIYLDFSLPEQQVARWSKAPRSAPAWMRCRASSFDGRITAMESQVDPNTRNFKAQATFQNPDGALRPGSFAKVGFALGGERDVLVIPQTAVSFNPYGNAVFVISKTARKPGEKDMQGKDLTGDKLIVKQRFIKTGATRGDLVAVTEGLKAGERVVTSGLLKLRNDAEVTINDNIQPSRRREPRRRKIVDARPPLESRGSGIVECPTAPAPTNPRRTRRSGRRNTT